ncbi:M15 family metallopeptidase [Streptomyces sp. NPDC091649]|uniref:M15 family metallopeptidase n=1 Tax=Streptomyces sp. NPDC091649 TaxID=3366004 RepID=UPI00381FAE7A
MLFIEGYRPLALQQHYFTAYRDEPAVAHSGWEAEQLHHAASRYVAPPEIAPHSAGAGVDVTPVDQDSHELDLGARVNASPQKCDGACFTHAPNLSDRTYYHRTLLLSAMEDADFTNYAAEFWHFSAAGRYDALMRREPHAFYGDIERGDGSCAHFETRRKPAEVGAPGTGAESACPGARRSVAEAEPVRGRATHVGRGGWSRRASMMVRAARPRAPLGENLGSNRRLGERLGRIGCITQYEAARH